MRKQVLLIKDVGDFKSGEVISVKAGFARNYLLPEKKAVIADKFSLRLQVKLKEERAKQAVIDKKDSEELAKKMEGMVLSIIVKVDPDGHMYGSVAIPDILRLLEAQGIVLERRNVTLIHPIKTLGAHPIHLKLKEGIPAQITLRIESDVPMPQQQAQEVENPAAE